MRRITDLLSPLAPCGALLTYSLPLAPGPWPHARRSGMYWGPMGEGPLGDARTYPPSQRWDSLATSLGDFVLEQCPRWLAFVEGVGHCMVDSQVGCPAPSAVGQDVRVSTWWGENLQ